MEVTKNGDKVYWTLYAVNNGINPEPNAKVQITIPPGLIIETYTADKGTLNKTTGLWTVGGVNVGTSYKNIVTFKVTDISLATEESGLFGFELLAEMTGDNIDPNSSNNTKTGFIEITNCPPSAGAVNDLNACFCGSVAYNDTPCTHGTTKYKLTLGSLVNIDPAFTLDEATGEYNVNGMILNPYEPAEFTYSIWCATTDGELQTSGLATVTFPALLSSSYTDTVVDLGNGYMKHTAMDGAEVQWPKGWTTVAENSGTGELVFTYPDGDTYTVDLGSVNNPGFTVFPSVITANLALTNLTLRNYTKINDSSGAVINIILPDPATLGLDPNKTFTWTFKRVNVHDTGSITLTPDNLKTIDGTASYVFPSNDFSSVTIWTDGTNWFIS